MGFLIKDISSKKFVRRKKEARSKEIQRRKVLGNNYALLNPAVKHHCQANSASTRSFIREAWVNLVWSQECKCSAQRVLFGLTERFTSRFSITPIHWESIEQIHVKAAARLLSNWSRMTSKCGITVTMITECVTNILTTFWCLVRLVTEQMQGNSVFVIYNKETKTMLMTWPMRLCSNWTEMRTNENARIMDNI